MDQKVKHTDSWSHTLFFIGCLSWQGRSSACRQPAEGDNELIDPNKRDVNRHHTHTVKQLHLL